MRVERKTKTSKVIQLCNIPDGKTFEIGPNFPIFMKTDIMECCIKQKRGYNDLSIPTHICTLICDEDDRAKMERVLCISITNGQGYMFPLGAGVIPVESTLIYEDAYV